MKSTITFLVNASFSRQCPKTWRRRAMIFVFTDCWEVIFWRKKRGKTPIFHIYRPLPYSSRDGENMLSSCPPSVKITPKILAKFASLNSSIAFGDLRLGGWLRTPCPQAPARAQSPTRNTRIKRRKFREDFVGYFGIRESEVYVYLRIYGSCSIYTVCMYSMCTVSTKMYHTSCLSLIHGLRKPRSSLAAVRNIALVKRALLQPVERL